LSSDLRGAPIPYNIDRISDSWIPSPVDWLRKFILPPFQPYKLYCIYFHRYVSFTYVFIQVSLEFYKDPSLFNSVIAYYSVVNRASVIPGGVIERSSYRKFNFTPAKSSILIGRFNHMVQTWKCVDRGSDPDLWRNCSLL
jgi:hypothetical protein